jgi:hypothetical protein
MCCGSATEYPASLREPVVTRTPTVDREFAEFCHRVAAAVFETLSEHGFDTVESGIMDAYFTHAEELSDPDGLCIRLLESMAIELTNHLDPSEQVTVLSAAASRPEYAFEDATVHSTPPSDNRTVDESLTVLRDVGLFQRSTRVANAEANEEESVDLVIEISGYTLRPHEGRLPLLPLALAVHRCTDAWVPIRMDASDGNWQVTFRRSVDLDTIGHPDQVFAPEVD